MILKGGGSIESKRKAVSHKKEKAPMRRGPPCESIGEHSKILPIFRSYAARVTKDSAGNFSAAQRNDADPPDSYRFKVMPMLKKDQRSATPWAVDC